MKATAINSGIESATRYIGPGGSVIQFPTHIISYAIGAGVCELRPSDPHDPLRAWFGWVQGRFGGLVYIFPHSLMTSRECYESAYQVWGPIRIAGKESRQ